MHGIDRENKWIPQRKSRLCPLRCLAEFSEDVLNGLFACLCENYALVVSNMQGNRV